jgi:hypothetical protein
MKPIMIACAPLVLLLAAFVDPLPPPLEPANAGMLLCILPDEPAEKFCASLVQYLPGEGGVIETFEQAMLGDDSPISWEGSYPQALEDGRICNRMLPEHAAAFRMSDGTGAEAILVKLARQYMVALARAMSGHDVCAGFETDADGVALTTWFDGQVSTLPVRRAIWVSPEDGYRVGP